MTLPFWLTPQSIHASLLPEPDPESGNDLYELTADHEGVVCGRKVVTPATVRTDFGSIPWWLHSVASPTDRHLRASYLLHDTPYQLEGGVRAFECRPAGNPDILDDPLTRLEVDCALLCNILLCEYFAAICAPGWWKNKLALLLFSFWQIPKALAIFVAVRLCGGKAWRSIDVGTVPSTKSTTTQS